MSVNPALGWYVRNADRFDSQVTTRADKLGKPKQHIIVTTPLFQQNPQLLYAALAIEPGSHITLNFDGDDRSYAILRVTYEYNNETMPRKTIYALSTSRTPAQIGNLFRLDVSRTDSANVLA